MNYDIAGNKSDCVFVLFVVDFLKGLYENVH